MDYAELRKQRVEQETNRDSIDYSWEVDNCPVLHSGFITCVANNPDQSQFSVLFYVSAGRYFVRLQDREHQEQAFLQVPSLSTAFVHLENALKNSDLIWKPMKAYSNRHDFR